MEEWFLLNISNALPIPRYDHPLRYRGSDLGLGLDIYSLDLLVTPLSDGREHWEDEEDRKRLWCHQPWRSQGTAWSYRSCPVEDTWHIPPYSLSCFLPAQAVLCEIESKNGIDAVDSSGKTILHWCSVSEESEKLIPELINTGLNINAVDKLGKTPLHYLAARGRLYGASCLLHHGADPNIIATSDQTTPLHYAVFTESLFLLMSVVRWLMEMMTL